MAAIALRREEAFGLGIAAVAHVALVALLVLRPAASTPLPPPERVTVTLSEDVGLTSTSPTPFADPAPDVAPELGEPPAPEPEPQPAPPPPPRPEPVRREPPPPAPKPVAKPAQKPVAKPVAQPVVKAAAKPEPAKPQPRASTPAKTNGPRPAASASPKPAPARAGGSRIGDDFLKGLPNARATGTSTTPAAAAIGPAVRSALSGAISREIKPHWVAPQGADAEKLVSILSFSLNRDGTLAGKPSLVRQEGITDANRAQAARHAEQAIRAVQLAAPFELPDQHYDAWKRVASFRFDKRLSQ